MGICLARTVGPAHSLRLWRTEDFQSNGTLRVGYLEVSATSVSRRLLHAHRSIPASRVEGHLNDTEWVSFVEKLMRTAVTPPTLDVEHFANT